jgi:O-antigen/teichoic acid export membrane protein
LVATAAPEAPAKPASGPGAARSAAAFTLGTALQRGLPYLFLPLYTRALSPAEYGALSILLAVSTAATFLFSFGLDLAVYRMYFQLDGSEDQKVFIDSIWRVLVAVPILLAVLFGAAVWPFLGHVPRMTGADGLLALLAAAVGVASTTVPYAVLRIRRQLNRFVFLTLLNGVATAVLTLLLVVVFDEGVEGWLVAAVGANLVSLIAALWAVPWSRAARFDRSMVVSAVKFGASIVPHSMAGWSLLLADRLILSAQVSGTDLGIYSLGSNLAIPILIAVQSLNQAVMPNYAKAGRGEKKPRSLEQIVLVQMVAAVGLGLAAALLATPVVALLAAPDFHGAAPVLAWTALGYVFTGMYFVPMNGATLAAGKTRLVWVRTVVSALVNIGLIIVLVPIGGIVLAAVASAAGYLCMLVLIASYSRDPRNPVRYPWRKLATLIGLGLFTFVVGDLTTPGGGIVGTLGRILWLVLFVISLFVCGVLDLKMVTRKFVSV